MISSQDFRNKYEKFYNQLRLYLWPYNVLEELAQVEVDIYCAFIDIEKLELDFNRLCSSIRDVCTEDQELEDSRAGLQELIDMCIESREQPYFVLSSVEEVHPNEDKQIKTIDKEDSEEQHNEDREEANTVM